MFVEDFPTRYRGYILDFVAMHDFEIHSVTLYRKNKKITILSSILCDFLWDESKIFIDNHIQLRWNFRKRNLSERAKSKILLDWFNL